jgi:hypothetical protein
MLDTEQDEFIIAARIPRIRHYATYLWQIDDEPSTRTVMWHEYRRDRDGAGYRRDRLPRRGGMNEHLPSHSF